MARIDSNPRFLRAVALSLCLLAVSVASVSAQGASKQQLDAAMVNKVEVKSAPLADVVASIRQTTGVNVVVRLPAQSQTSAAMPRVTLTMTHIPLLEALKYIASEVNMKVKIEPYAVVLVPMTEDADPMVTATFRVPPNFIPNSTGASGTNPNPLDQPAALAQ